MLEVGCGQGNNLRPISRILEPRDVWGIDVNEGALARTRANAPGVNVVDASARWLPFRDGLVDLAFTVGVLVHQPDSTLPIVMSEIVRCSRRFVLWIEYHADQPEDVPYHDEPGTLIKRAFGRVYQDLFPELVERAGGISPRLRASIAGPGSRSRNRSAASHPTDRPESPPQRPPRSTTVAGLPSIASGSSIRSSG